MKRRVLIYDTSGAYLRYFKINFPEDIWVVNFFKVEDPASINFANLDAVIILVNDTEELVDLLWFCMKAKNIFVGFYTNFYNIKKMRERFRKFEGIIQLDLNSPKMDMLEFIMFHLDAIAAHLVRNRGQIH